MQPGNRYESAPLVLSLPAEPDIDRPKSPWTPSYSVLTQGPGTPGQVAEAEVAEVQPILRAANGLKVVDEPQIGEHEVIAKEATPTFVENELSDVSKSTKVCYMRQCYDSY